MYKFLFIGNSTYSNRGCEAIVRGTSEILKKHFYENYTIYSVYFDDGILQDAKLEKDKNVVHIPVKTKLTLSAIIFYCKNFSNPALFKVAPMLSDRRVRNVLKKIDMVFMVGGDNFTLDYGKPDLFFAINNYFRTLKKKFVIWGASVGPFSQMPDYEQFCVKELKKVKYIYCRESETFKYLSRYNLKNLIEVADPGFLLPPEETVLNENIENILNNGCIGLNLSPLLARFKSSLSVWIEESSAIIKKITDTTKLPVLLIPHVSPHFLGLSGDDYLFLKEVKDRMSGNVNNVVLLENHYSAGQLKFIISRLKIFAGARTHSTIAALSSCVPTICFSYSMKAKGISRDVYSNDKWLIESKDLNISGITNKIIELLNDEEQVRKHLKNVIVKIKENAYMAAEHLKNSQHLG